MSSAISLRNLKKTYANGFEAIKGINLDIPQGTFFALLGPNGAGKSTTIGVVTGLTRPTSGHVEVNGFDIMRDPVQAKSSIGLVPQEFNFSIFETVHNIITTQAGYYGIPLSESGPRADMLLKDLGLFDKRHEASRNLSGGMKRRLMIARALIHAPQILILDEPTAGVDIELRREMWEFLKKLNQSGVTIILTTHYLEEAETLCDRVAIINHGEIVQEGNMKDLLSTMNESSYLLDTADGETLEVSIKKTERIGSAIAKLEQEGKAITSLRNKTNRLEELFLKLTQKTEKKSTKKSQ
jgi:ABC-2 type transport system ATP-binding protein